MRIFLFILFVNISFFSYCQKKSLNGLILDSKSKEPLYNSHILNLNILSGTTPNKEGAFSIASKVNDTIIISHIGYESIKLKVTNDLLKADEIQISLNEKPEEVKEIIINSTKLIGILEVDVKMVPQDKFTRIKLTGVPQTYEVGKPVKSNSIISKIFNPIDGLYSLFGKKPKNLKKLKKLKKENHLRQIFSQKFDREVMMEYLNLNKRELENLLDKCNYSSYFIKKASDLQITEAILDCYENKKAIERGSININKKPN